MTRPQVLAVGAVFAAYCGLTPFVPPADDELYYWCWAQTLQLSYYDHPPMVAYLIRVFTELFGDSLFATRLPACLSTACVFAAVLHLTRPARIAWWLLATPLFSLGAVLVTPDTPLLMFWAGYVVWLVAVHRHLDSSADPVPVRMWLLGGVILGCGVLGKYTTGLAVPAGFLAFVLAGNWKRWLPGYIFHGVVSFLVASPILVHNIRHDFVPLMYQWKHSMGTTDPSLGRFGEFVGIQLLLFGTMPVVLFPWVLANARRLAADPRLRVCLCLYGFPFAFFLYKAARGPLEGNWALVSYIAFWPLAGEWWARRQESWFKRAAPTLSFVLPVLAVGVMTVHLIHPLAFLSPHADRVTRQADKYELAKRIAADWQSRPDRLPMYTDTYQWVALLRFCGVDARQVDGVTRPSHFTQTPERVTDRNVAFVLWEGPAPHKVTPGFAKPELLDRYPLRVRGELLTTFQLWRYTKDGTAAVDR